MSALYNKKDLNLEESLDRGLEKFMRTSYRELSDTGFHSFWFNVKIKEKTICVYLYYDLDGEESEQLLSWHIYLQEELDKVLEKIDLGKFDAVVLIVEAYDLWITKETIPEES